jgi:hypothetical protein
MFAFIFSLWKDKSGPLDLIKGMEFGVVCWLTFSIPIEIGNAVYVNYSGLFVFGKCLSSLVEYIIAGIIASKML